MLTSNWDNMLFMVVLLLHLAEYFAKANINPVENEKNDLDWWQTAVFYQIYPRSFKDSNGDGVGDLKGIEEKAEHFKDIGVDCVWLSPIFKSPMADFGYDISDYNEIDSIYGTMDDFISLQKKLKSLDLKLILDFVPNHSSDEHEWFEKSVNEIDPYTDYYVWKDGLIDEDGYTVPPNDWQSLFNGSAWTWNETREQYYLHQFSPKQPDLNYRCKGLLEEMKKNMRFWLDLGVDGYRVDAVPHLLEDANFSDEPRKPAEIAEKELNTYDHYYHTYTMDLDETYDLIGQFRGVLEEYKQKDGKTRVMITEAYTTLEKTMRYYGHENNLGAHLAFNFGFITDLDEQSNASNFNKAIYTWLDNMPEGASANWVIGNHDRPRVATRFGSEMVDAMNMLNLLLPGATFTYLGEEIGMEDTYIRWDQTVDTKGVNAGPKDYRLLSRDPSRTPFQWDASENSGFTVNPTSWLPVNPNYWKLNLEAQKAQIWSNYSVYKRLTQLKKTRTVQRGSFDGHVLSEWVYAFTRSLPGAETYLVVMNVGTESEVIDFSDLPVIKDETWHVHTPSVNSQYFMGETLNKSGFDMRPKSALVLTNRKESLTSSSPSLRLSSALSVVQRSSSFLAHRFLDMLKKINKIPRPRIPILHHDP